MVRTGMDKWQSIADQKIREAMEAGEFDNLRGRGKPLKLERNPFEPADLRLAHMVLEGAGMSPAWIEERKHIDGAVDGARQALVEAASSTVWPAAVVAFRAAAARLNQRILSYNLSVPSGGFQRVQVDVEWEIARVMASVPPAS
jgi:hypothetical protein